MSALSEQKFPTFGKNRQNELPYQAEIDVLKQHVSEIVTHIEVIEADILNIYSTITNIVADLAWLTANALTSLTIESTYDSTACPGLPVVDIFDAPTVTPTAHGQHIVLNARPLVSTDNSVLVSYDATCGFVNLQVADPVTLTSAGGTESLVYTGSGPNLELKALVAGSGVSLVSTPTTMTINGTGTNIELQSVGSGTSIVSAGTGPNLAVKSLVAGSGIVLGSTASDITVAADGTNVTLSSTGAGVSLVTDGAGPDMAIYGLTAGSNISVTLTSPTVTIAQTQVDKSYGTFYYDGANFNLNHAANLTWIALALPVAWLTYTTSADWTVFGTNYVRYTGATTKIFSVTTYFSFNNTSASIYNVYIGLRVNGLTVLPDVSMASSSSTIQWNTVSFATSVSLATNDYLEVLTQTDNTGGGAYPATIGYARPAIVITEA